jgi:hypothetical protein
VQQKWAFVHALTCKVMKQKSGSASGWPDWENFRQMEGNLLWPVVLKITGVAHICGYFFPPLRVHMH